MEMDLNYLCCFKLQPTDEINKMTVETKKCMHYYDNNERVLGRVEGNKVKVSVETKQTREAIVHST